MDRPAPHQLSDLARRRHDALDIARAAVRAVSPAVVLPRALDSLWPSLGVTGRPLHLLAVGKAAAGMYTACRAAVETPPVSTLVIGPGDRPSDVPEAWWVTGGHPTPTEGSVTAGRRALEMARRVPPNDCLVLLVSGGASALMAAPADGLSLATKQQATSTVMRAGGDITALNAVRKHLSAVKGGRLAAACAGHTVTLALSDVVGDDLSVIGSGPGVPDATTWDDARDALRRFGGPAHHPDVAAHIEAGCRGEHPDTPKPTAASMARATGHVIGGRHHAMAAAATAAAACGYTPVVLDQAVVGEARVSARAWWDTVSRLEPGRHLAVISSGETTVRVTGDGRGGRNQEFGLALVDVLERRNAVLLSMGTDGIDGPTDAAGALVDSTTRARGAAAGLAAPDAFLARNDAYAYLLSVGDLVTTGPSGTNVGDLQVLLLSPS